MSNILFIFSLTEESGGLLYGLKLGCMFSFENKLFLY